MYLLVSVLLAAGPILAPEEDLDPELLLNLEEEMAEVAINQGPEVIDMQEIVIDDSQEDFAAELEDEEEEG